MHTCSGTLAAALVGVSGFIANAQECMWTLRDGTALPSGFGIGGPVVYDPLRSRLVSFGGPGVSSDTLRNTSEWNGTGWVIVATTGPGKRIGQAMAYDSTRGRVVMFGGSYNVGWYLDSVLKDTWTWNGTAWTLASIDGPALQFRPVMAYDSARDRMVMYSETGLTFEWDGAAWNAGAALPGPGARWGHAMTYDSDRQRIVLAGGNVGTTATSTIWEYDGVAWSLRTPVGAVPPGFSSPNGVAYDTARHRIVVVSSAPNATWEFDSAAATWTQRSVNQPAAMRQFGALAYDSNNHRCLMPASSYFYGTAGDMWEFDGNATTEPPILQQPVSSSVTVFQQATFTVNAPGATSIRWHHNNVPMIDGLTVSGSSTNTLTLAQCGQSASGSYSALIQGPCGPYATQLVSLTVNSASCYANCDGSTSSPAVTAGDFQCFLNQFAQGMSEANCDGSTSSPMLTANDFQCFLNAYAQCQQ